MSTIRKQPGASLSRQRLLKTAAAAGGLAAGSGTLGGFPTIWAQNIKDIVLHHAGPPVTTIPAIAEQANKDLGFAIQMQATKQGTAPYKVLYATDAGGQGFHDCPPDWLTGVPTVTNADTLAPRPDLVGRKVTSWATCCHRTSRARRRCRTSRPSA